jgi:phosphoribosylanthranilate isomerase
MVRVKICGLARQRDVSEAVKAGADALGFVFAERSKRVIGADEAKILVREVPAFVSRVGLFMDQDASTIADVLKKVPLSLLQFHGSESAGFCRQFGLPYIKALSITDRQALSRAEQDYFDAAGLLLDSHAPGGAGGTGKVFDWSEIPEIGLPLVLAGGLTPENVGQAVQQVKPWAVDVSSGVEDAPGQKSAAKMQSFINEAKREY